MDEASRRAELILIPTPIGNPGDLSARAGETIAGLDLLLCEDKRITAALLASLHLPHVPLLSYHRYNEQLRLETVLAELASGKRLGLVSDAGMPAISDPGEALVAAVLAAGYAVRALPGPNAGLTALSASGLSTRYCHFEGFLPKAGSERRERLHLLTEEAATLILYEAPHRLLRTLSDLQETGLGARRLCIAHELTKSHESYWRGTLEAALAEWAQREIRGEFVLVLEGREAYWQRVPEAAAAAAREARQSAGNAARELLTAGLSPRAALEILAPQSGLGRNELYALIRSLAP